MSAPGDYRESPTTGVGTINYLNDDSGLFFRDVAIQMQADGIKVKSVSFDDNGELEIIGGYEQDNS